MSDVSPLPAARRRMRLPALRHGLTLFGAAIVGLAIFVAIFAPSLAPHNPFAQNLNNRLIPPLWMGGQPGHLLGTDQLGRDYLSRLIFGARISIIIGVSTVVASGLIGITLGLLGGFYGGRIDDAVMFLITCRLSIPIILVALTVVAMIGSSLTIVILTLGLLLWDRFAVVARTATMQVRNLDYVAAARSRRRLAPARAAARGSAQHRQPSDRGGNPGNGAGDHAGSLALLPWPRRAAAVAELGADDRRSQGLHVLQPLGDHDPRHRFVRAHTRHQPAGRRLARPARRGSPAMSAFSTEPVLDITNLRISFGTRAEPVRGLSLRIHRGETHCLVGESGCGKSISALSVMNLLAKGATRSADHIRFHQQDLLKLPEREMARLRGNKIAMIFQEPMTSLNPAYTIGSQMAEVLERHRRATRRQALDKAADLLARVGVTAPGMRLGQYPHQLSGGLRQRVMIAMALMCDPELLIADEPTTALDVTVQAQILRLLQEIQQERGLALWMITHDLGVVARMANRVSVMYAGPGGGKRAGAAALRRAFAPLYPWAARLCSRSWWRPARRAARQHSRHRAAPWPWLHRLRFSRPVQPCRARMRRRRPDAVAWPGP